MRAVDIMQKDILAVSPELPVESLEEFFATEDISGAPVQNERGQIVGIVSKTDLVRAFSGRDESGADQAASEGLTVEDIMTTDVVTVIKGVIAAEEEAIAGYAKLIEVCDGVDYVTQDLAITLMADEQEHRREFIGFLKEYEGAAT